MLALVTTLTFLSHLCPFTILPADKDGLSQTILKVGAFGKALDPMNRLLFATPLQVSLVQSASN